MHCSPAVTRPNAIALTQSIVAPHISPPSPDTPPQRHWRQDPGRRSNVGRVRAEARALTGQDIPTSFEESVAQARESIETLTSVKKRARGIKRLSVEIPVLDTGIQQSFFIVENLVSALRLEKKAPVTILFCKEEYLDAARKQFPENPCGLISAVLDGRMSVSRRLVVFSPQEQDEESVFQLLEDRWSGDVVVLCNAIFSESFRSQRAAFLRGFNTVYCFMPLAIQLFISRQDGVLFKWQREKADNVQWHIFLSEKDSFKKIGQTQDRPNQEELELAFYNAAASESFITKGIQFFQSFGKAQ